MTTDDALYLPDALFGLQQRNCQVTDHRIQQAALPCRNYQTYSWCDLIFGRQFQYWKGEVNWTVRNRCSFAFCASPKETRRKKAEREIFPHEANFSLFFSSTFGQNVTIRN